MKQVKGSANGHELRRQILATLEAAGVQTAMLAFVDPDSDQLMAGQVGDVIRIIGALEVRKAGLIAGVLSTQTSPER